MTREQVQEAFRQNLREFPNLLEQTDRAIDLYVALGMLKLDEPKKAGTELADIIVRHTSEGQARCILNAITNAKIEVIKK